MAVVIRSTDSSGVPGVTVLGLMFRNTPPDTREWLGVAAPLIFTSSSCPVAHQFSQKHLQRYVDEFAYRLNEGNVRVHTMDRIDALIGKTLGVRLTYANLTGEFA